MGGCLHLPAAVERELRPVKARILAQAKNRPYEVVAELLGLEGDDVRAEHSVQQLVAKRQPRKELGRRERNVQEEADGLGGAGPAEKSRQAGKLVVVHPEQRVARCDFEGGLGKPAVCLAVVMPPPSLDLDPVDQAVEERPQRSVCKAVVIALDLRAVERDGDELGVPPGERRGRRLAIPRPTRSSIRACPRESGAEP